MELFPQSNAIDPNVVVAELIAVLSKCKFRFFDEDGLQAGLNRVFVANHFSFVREKALNKADRPDFLMDGGIAIEVKIKGSFAQFIRQASRYLEDPRVKVLLIVGTPSWISKVPTALHGKPIFKHRLLASLL